MDFESVASVDRKWGLRLRCLLGLDSLVLFTQHGTQTRLLRAQSTEVYGGSGLVLFGRGILDIDLFFLGLRFLETQY